MRKKLVSAGLATLLSTPALGGFSSTSLDPWYYRSSPMSFSQDVASFVEGETLSPYRSVEERSQYRRLAYDRLLQPLEPGAVNDLFGELSPNMMAVIRVNNYDLGFFARPPPSPQEPLYLQNRMFGLMQSVSGDEEYAKGLITINFIQTPDGQITALSAILKKDGSSPIVEWEMGPTSRISVERYVSKAITIFQLSLSEDSEPNKMVFEKTLLGATDVFFRSQSSLYMFFQDQDFLSSEFYPLD